MILRRRRTREGNKETGQQRQQKCHTRRRGGEEVI
jgi:hypothetical protein